ncbi:hypothetical protein P3T73_05520 [Kiritimatiellota bacterium B12222]|nr:hypothetical protein P3T73_05520 [Kiritimatiellota bacterium B12222]
MSAAWADRLKSKWGIESNFSFWMIMLTFTLAGSSISQIRPLYWGLLGFTKEHPSMWVKVPTYLLLVFPTYQISLMIFGTLLGQFNFFWKKEKAMLLFFAKPFRKKSVPPTA